MPNEVWRYAEPHPISSTPLTNTSPENQARFLRPIEPYSPLQ